MPVKEKVNKSAEIRKLHSSGINSAADIVAKLKAQGVKVTPALVYNVLSNKKSKRKHKSKAAGQSTEKATIIDTAVLFVRQSGGMQKAKELLLKLSLLHE